MNNPTEINLKQALALIKDRQTDSNKKFIKELSKEITSFSEVMNEIQLHEGNCAMEHLLIGEQIILINGNLDITHTLQDAHKADKSMLIVLGNIKCTNLITLSSIYILGDLIVDNVILADSYCDYSLNVGGNLKTKTILEYGHYIVAGKKITAKNIFTSNSIVDKNGDVEETMTSEKLVTDIVKVEHGEHIENLGKTIDYIKKGGTEFRKKRKSKNASE